MVEAIDEKLLDSVECAICLGIPRGRVVQCVNGHLFCASCLGTHQLTGGDSCPTCRVRLERRPIRSLLAENLLYDMQGPCLDINQGGLLTTRVEAAAASVLLHVATCTDSSKCEVPHCLKMKRIHEHFLQCAQTNCNICKKMKLLIDMNEASCSTCEDPAGAAEGAPPPPGTATPASSSTQQPPTELRACSHSQASTSSSAPPPPPPQDPALSAARVPTQDNLAASAGSQSSTDSQRTVASSSEEKADEGVLPPDTPPQCRDSPRPQPCPSQQCQRQTTELEHAEAEHSEEAAKAAGPVAAADCSAAPGCAAGTVAEGVADTAEAPQASGSTEALEERQHTLRPETEQAQHLPQTPSSAPSAESSTAAPLPPPAARQVGSVALPVGHKRQRPQLDCADCSTPPASTSTQPKDTPASCKDSAASCSTTASPGSSGDDGTSPPDKKPKKKHPDQGGHAGTARASQAGPAGKIQVAIHSWSELLRVVEAALEQRTWALPPEEIFLKVLSQINQAKRDPLLEKYRQYQSQDTAPQECEAFLIGLHRIAQHFMDCLTCMYTASKEDTQPTSSHNPNKRKRGVQGMVECELCAKPPKEQKVVQCANGHLFCQSCLDNHRQQGANNCPTCFVKFPRVQIRSLLAEKLAAKAVDEGGSASSGMHQD